MPSARITCQSAPPGSTRPERRSPTKRPPVMAMMRLRPSGPAPSSCAGASSMSALKRACSFKGLQHPEELAGGARRLAFLLRLPRGAEERADFLEVGAGMLRGEMREGGVVGEQALAPRL